MFAFPFPIPPSLTLWAPFFNFNYVQRRQRRDVDDVVIVVVVPVADVVVVQVAS